MKLPATFATVLIAGQLATLLVACGGAAANANAATIDDRQAETILAASRIASGGAAWERIDTIVSDSVSKTPQGEVTFRNSVDLRAGRDRLDFTLGPMKGVLGWDGKQAWTVNPETGKAAIEVDQVEIARRRTVAYQDVYGYYFPKRLAARTSYVGRKREGGAFFDVISVTPVKGHAFELWIDTATHLVAKQVSPSVEPPQTQYFSDYREVDGVKIPFATHTVMMANGQDMGTSRVQYVKTNVPLGDADFSMPASATLALPATPASR